MKGRGMASAGGSDEPVSGGAPKKRKKTESGEGEGEVKAKKSRKKKAEEDVDDEGEESQDHEPLSSTAAKNAMPRLVLLLQSELNVDGWKVEAAATFFREGATLPFVARYRKDQTGGLDEEQLRKLQMAMEKFDKLEVRKITVSAAIEKTGSLSDKLKAKIHEAKTLAEVEDIYLPYKAKRKTRASEARNKGLQPLADMLMGKTTLPFTAQDVESMGPVEAAKKMSSSCPEVPKAKDCLAGARDIIAEEVMEDAAVRQAGRGKLVFGLEFSSKERKSGSDEMQKYTRYHEFSRSWRSGLRAYEVLAMSRGLKEKVLSTKFKVAPTSKDNLITWIMRHVGGNHKRPHSGAWAAEVQAALEDGVDRLLQPALEREWWKQAMEMAEESSLQTFAENLRHKLLQPPIKGCGVVAIDPGYRTGCKVAVVSETGKLLATDTIFLQGRNAEKAAETALLSFIDKYKCSTIGLGNGQGSREAEAFLRTKIIAAREGSRYTVVDEAGASVYSASPIAGQELGEINVSLRGAVSLGRRLQDPLAELVKVTPKSIGVGLYQHDVDQKRLTHELGRVVEIAVNTVGVDANTASPSLLRYIAGLSDKVAKSIVKHREDSGPFATRKELLKVAGLGPKSFEQAAGFLRVYDGPEHLDSTAIHPESYDAARVLVSKFKGKVSSLSAAEVTELTEKLKIGAETLKDMAVQLSGQQRDPREELLGIPPVVFTNASGTEETVDGRKVLSASAEGLTRETLKEGMWLRGTVRNVVEFGCFVDIGVQQDALLHRLEMEPGKGMPDVGRVLQVRVKAVDLKHPSGKARISVSTKQV